MTTKQIFFWWLPLAIATTVISILVYLTAQQVLRMSANDEPVQVAEDVANLLSAGEPVQAIVPPGLTIDMSKSLAEYIIIFDSTGKPLASTVQLNGKTPVPPAGVFSSVEKHGEDRITWQPASGIRSAAVITRWSGTGQSGFVVSGRSLREIEDHESEVESIVVAAWIFSLTASFAASYFYGRFVLRM